MIKIFFMLIQKNNYFKTFLLCSLIIIICIMFYNIQQYVYFFENFSNFINSLLFYNNVQIFWEINNNSLNIFSYLFGVFYKNLILLLKFYFIESFLLINIIFILSFKIKMFFKESFWTLKKFQKHEIYLLKKNIIFLIIAFILNCFFLKYNITITNLYIEKNIYIIELKNSLFSCLSKESFLNNYANICFKNIILFFFIFITTMYYIELKKVNTNSYKNIFIFFILLNFFLIFSIFFINCYDFFLFFILLMGINICTYSLLLFDENNRSTREASIKYFLSSTIGTLFILGGISLIFLIYKTTNFFILQSIIIQNQNLLLEEKLKFLNKIIFFMLNVLNEPIFIKYNIEEIYKLNNFIWKYNNFVIIIFFFIGFNFKLALFPLHFWSVEVYSAIKYRLISIFILILKLIFFIKFIQIFFFIFQIHKETFKTLKNIIIIIATLSIIFGSLAGLFEDKIKKIIAYSSINQLGFILISICTVFTNNFYEKNYWNFIESLQIAIFFMLIYLFSNLILLWFLNRSSTKKEIIYIKDLNKKPFILLFPIILTILSFSGLPPLAGFFSKFLVLYICWKNNFVSITFIALFCSILSNYYYLKIIKINLFDSEENNLIINKKNNKEYTKKKYENVLFVDIILYLISIYLLFFFYILEFVLKISFILSINSIYYL